MRLFDSVGAIDIEKSGNELVITQEGLNGNGEQYLNIPVLMLEAFIDELRSEARRIDTGEGYIEANDQ